MFEGKTTAVVVPAHNEQNLIIKAMQQVPHYVDHLIVVDDASVDSTGKILMSIPHQNNLHIVFHEVNRGVGGAIVSGYKKAVALGAQIVAVMAGDAQMDPADLPNLLAPLARGEADYAKGDRLSWPGVASQMPFLRFLGNHALSLMTKLTSGYKELRDSQCGYTAISSDMLKRLDLDALYERYGFPNDILAHLHAVHARIFQVAVRPIYSLEKSEISIVTALVKVPIVLIRSLINRLKKEKASQADIQAHFIYSIAEQEIEIAKPTQ